MNFTREDRKKVYDFFENILTTYYTEPVYYEYVRGHVSKAPEVVKQYILKKCKGDNLLDYFRRRKNYFEVEGTRISLRKEPRTKAYPEKASIKKKKEKKPMKFNRQRSDDSFSNASDNQPSSEPSNLTQKLEHEEFVLRHFLRLLESNTTVKIESINFEKLPKKVIRHLTLYCNKSVMNYLSNFPDTFQIDDNGNVSLLNEAKICHNPIPENGTDSFCEKNEDIIINPEVQNAYIWLESIEFFSDILKRKKTKSLHIDKLASYLTQAVEGVKTFLKTYKPFKTFFSSSSLIFYLKEDEVVLSDHYKNVLQLARSRIQYAFNEPESEASLSSDLHIIVNSQYSSDDELSSELSEDQDTDNEMSDTESIIEISDEEENKSIEQKDEGMSKTSITLIKSDEDISDEKEKEQINDPEPDNSSSVKTIECEPDVEPSKTINYDECDANFLRFLFIVEMFCTEAVEKENDYLSQYTIKSVEFFVGILKDSSQRWSVISLHGTLGQASPDVISFINKKYKGERFGSFFQEHEEFLLKSSLVSLSPTYRDSFQKRLDLFLKSEQEFCFENLYESTFYKTVLKEIFAFFFEVHQRLINNSKIKINRLCNIIEHFPNCFEWIKSTNGKTLLEKIELFLKMVNIFEISDGGFVSITSEKYNDSLKKWLQQMSEAFQNSKLDMPVFKLVNDSNSTETEKLSYNSEKDCFWSLVEFFENIMEDVNGLHYYEVVDILPTELLLKIGKTDKDSRIIISALLANKLFVVKNGRILLNNYKHNSVGLDLLNEHENSDITVQKSLASSIHENQIIATDIHVPGFKDSFTWSPICDPMEDVKGAANKTDVSSERDPNAINENHILLKADTYEKDKLHDDSYSYISFLTPNNNMELSNDSTIDVSPTINGESQTEPILEKCSVGQPLNEISDLGSLNQTNDSEMTVKDQESSYQINGFSENVAIHSESGDTKDFDSEVSDNQSLESEPEVPLILSDTSDFILHHTSSYYHLLYHTSSISDDESDVNCEISDLTIISKAKSSISNLLKDNDDFDCQIISPISVEIDGDINFHARSGLKVDEDDRENQSVISNIPESTRKVLVKKHPDVIEVHSEEEIDIDAQIGTSYKSVCIENNKEKTAIEVHSEEEIDIDAQIGTSYKSVYIENSKEEIISENRDIFTHLKVGSEGNKILEMDQSEKNVSNVKFLNVGMKTEDVNRTEIKNYDSILEMECKANCLAREVFTKRGTFNKVFVATSNFIFYVIKGDTLDENKHFNEIVKNSLNFDKSSPAIENSFLTSSKSPCLEPSINELDSLEKRKGCKDSEESNKSFEYPLQPITANIILLTADSCIAQAEVASRKQNIYFLKCVFSCEEENCCSECFDVLRIGDSVSCFVPIPEMSRKMWIPIMVSKEGSDNFNGTDYINQMLQNQCQNGSFRQCEVDVQLPCKKSVSENISTQTEYICSEEECQTEYFCSDEECQTEILSEETCCQTDLSGEVRKKFSSSEVMCQTDSVLVQDVSLQVVCSTNSIDCQTDISGINTISIECQTDLVGSVKECVDSVNSLCQTNLSGNVKESVIIVDSDTQTISTGPVMVMQYYHF